MTEVNLIQPWKTGSSQLLIGAPGLLKDKKVGSNPTAQGLQQYIESTSHDAHSQGTGSVWISLKDKDIYTVVKSDSR